MKIGVSSDISFSLRLKANENKKAGGSALSSATTGGFVSIDSERCIYLALRSVSRIFRFLLPRRLEPETGRRNEDRSFVGHFLFPSFESQRKQKGRRQCSFERYNRRFCVH